MIRHFLGATLPLLALSISSTPAQQTLVVGPGQTYTTIQPAIAAASPGDTVLVLAGTYSQALDIDKGIQLIGQGARISGPSGLLSTFALVHDLPANQRFTMAGFMAVEPSGQVTTPDSLNIAVRDCAGPIALRDLSSDSGFRRFVVGVTRCPQVFVGSLTSFGLLATNSNVVCEGAFLEGSGFVLRCVDSSMVVVSCTIRGTSSPFAVPAWVERSRLVTSRSTFASGATVPRSAINATDAELFLDPSTVLQPSGGAPAIQGGVAVPFPFASIRAQLSTSDLTVTSHGTANETFATVVGPVINQQATPFGLTWLDPTRTSLLGFASYGANRLHTLTLPLPPLPPGLVVGLQTVGFRPSGIELGGPSLVVTR